jgi:hypothetical protein
LYALLVGLDVADLATVGTPPSRACRLFGRRLGGAFSSVFAGAAFAIVLHHLLLLLALVATFFVLFEAFALFLDAERDMVSRVRKKEGNGRASQF